MVHEEKMMRDVYCECLMEAAAKDDRIVVMEADLMKATGTEPFFLKYPEKSVNVGIAECNMVSMAGGMSAMGKIPFAATFTAFITRRAFDQITLSVAYAQQNVRLVGTDPGITAEINGGTHMSMEDVAIMRSVPTMTIFEPIDGTQLKKAFPQIIDYYGPMYIRLNRRTPAKIYDDSYEFQLGKADILKEGTDVTLVASGIMVEQALLAAEDLAKEGINAEVIAIHTIKPLDNEAIIASAKKTGAVVTAENASYLNGLGGAVCECLSENYPTPVQRVGVKDHYGEVGFTPFLQEKYHLMACDIVEAAKKAIAMK
ncbi:transketolase family protein [Anaerolentibacter hominis]|uniref:transketolase family protein n=1 Tax=Anaerolentibacter hominis TaxID=3079009 RepID=UPI0031B806A9